MNRPTLADHERRLTTIEKETVPLVIDIHNMLVNAGFNNGTGVIMREVVEAARERLQQKSEAETLAEARAIAARRLAASKAGHAWRFVGGPRKWLKWAAGAIVAAALWRVGALLPLDKLVAAVMRALGLS